MKTRRFHIKIQISGFPWKFKQSGDTGRNVYPLSVRCEFCLPNTEAQLVSPPLPPVRPCEHLSVGPLLCSRYTPREPTHGNISEEPHGPLFQLADSHTCWFSVFPCLPCPQTQTLFFKISAHMALKIMRHDGIYSISPNSSCCQNLRLNTVWIKHPLSKWGWGVGQAEFVFLFSCKQINERTNITPVFGLLITPSQGLALEMY